MDCLSFINADWENQCPPKTLKGLEKRVLLFLFKDIDRVNTKISENKLFVEKLFVRGRVYRFQVEKYSHLSANQKYNKGFSHELQMKLYPQTEQHFQQIERATFGTYVAIVETQDKSQNGRFAYEILGFDAGLSLTSVQRDYDKNGVTLSFATPQNVKELRPFYKWLEKDYATTKKRFDSKLNYHSDSNKIFDFTFDYTFE